MIERRSQSKNAEIFSIIPWEENDDGISEEDNTIVQYDVVLEGQTETMYLPPKLPPEVVVYQTRGLLKAKQLDESIKEDTSIENKKAEQDRVYTQLRPLYIQQSLERAFNRQKK